mmetsp:Transcript_16100/g.28591  ORF Transcript_16100/g.28591 Transcript_16100/m.28591 type:complete len:215 (-) Transcript_16100:77-721(-)
MVGVRAWVVAVGVACMAVCGSAEVVAEVGDAKRDLGAMVTVRNDYRGLEVSVPKKKLKTGKPPNCSKLLRKAKSEEEKALWLSFLENSNTRSRVEKASGAYASFWCKESCQEFVRHEDRAHTSMKEAKKLIRKFKDKPKKFWKRELFTRLMDMYDENKFTGMTKFQERMTKAYRYVYEQKLTPEKIDAQHRKSHLVYTNRIKDCKEGWYYFDAY